MRTRSGQDHPHHFDFYHAHILTNSRLLRRPFPEESKGSGVFFILHQRNVGLST